MRAIETLLLEAEQAYKQLESAVAETTEAQSWATLTLRPDAYLHTNGSVIAIVQHMAVCKFMYASAGFRNLELRWRDCFERLEKIGTSWEATVAYLSESQRYWTSAWQDLADQDLAKEVTSILGDQRPAWKIIWTVNQHDAYHAGQIFLMNTILEPATAPPDMDFEGERKYVQDLPTW